MKTFMTVVVSTVVIAGGIFAYLWSGGYNVSATVPHWGVTLKLLKTVRDRSIIAHSKGISVPLRVTDAKSVEKGLHHYHPMCRLCHGAPGYEREEFAQGLYPKAPDLASQPIQQKWSEAELYWIVRNGLKMTGMPSFGVTHGEEELWGLVALLRQLPKLQPGEYHRMIQAVMPTEADGH